MLSGRLPQVKKDHFLLRGFVCIGFVLLILGSISPDCLFAQTTSPDTSPAPSELSSNSPRNDLAGRTVESVRVLGNTTVSSAVILNLVRTHEGDKYDPQTAEDDYQRIFGLRKFSNVEAKVEPTDTGGVIVAFVVTEQRQVRSISFRGNFDVQTTTLQDAVDVKVGEAIDQFRLAISKQAIVNTYKDHNFPFAHVDIDTDALARRGDVVFTIVEGPNVRIRNIKFIGAEHYTNDRLRGQIQSKTWIFILRHGTYDPDTVDDDVATVHHYYEQKGFFDIRVGRKLIWSPDMTELQINFVVDEGARYIVDRVTFKGNASISDVDLRKNLKLVEGVAYDDDLLQRDIRQIVKAYSPFGFIYQPQSQDPDFLRIDAHPVFSREPGHCELVYDISEGKPFRLGRIIPKGNTRTQDKVILREMHMYPGQLYNSAETQDASDRLRGTPYFSKVTMTPIGDNPEYRDLLVEVEEAKTASFNIGAGVNTNGGLSGNLTYEQHNFDITNWPTSWKDIFTDRAFIGAGQDFRASFEPGTLATNASLRFTEPWILDQPYSFTGEVYLRDRIRDNYNDNRYGTRFSLGKRFNDIWSATITLRAEDVDIVHIHDKEIRAQEILDLAGNSTITSAGLRITRDTTTRGLLPDKGMTDTAGYEQVGALGGDFSFERFSYSHDQYFGLHEDLLGRKVILALHGDTGYITPDAPFFERYYGGGIGSIRGFKFRGVSPRSGPHDDAVGGDFVLTGSAELSFPIAGEELRGVVFSDAGTVEPDAEIGTIRASVGAGVRFTLPILGRIPIALDLAIPISKNSQDQTQLVSFSLGFSPY